MAATVALNLGWEASWTWLTRTGVEHVLVAAVSERAEELQDKREQSLANKIANAVGRMLSGKDG